MKTLLSLVAMVFFLAACGGDTGTPAPEQAAEDAAPAAEEMIFADAAEAVSSAKLGEWGVETQYIDDSVDPGDDFYRYVNGGWLEQQEIPAGFSRLSSFLGVQLETEDQVQAIIDDIVAQDWPAGSTEANVKALY